MHMHAHIYSAGGGRGARATRLQLKQAGSAFARPRPPPFPQVRSLLWLHKIPLHIPQQAPGTAATRAPSLASSGLQGVYNTFIRPSLAPEELLVLPCDEANGHEGSGYPGLPSNCSGRFVSHYWGWGGHEKATKAFKEAVLRYAEEAMLFHASVHGQLQQFT